MKTHGKKICFAAENIDLFTLLSPDQVENCVRTVLNDKSLSPKMWLIAWLFVPNSCTKTSPSLPWSMCLTECLTEIRLRGKYPENDCQIE